MVIQQGIFVIVVMVSLMSCESDFNQACEKHPEVCQQLQQQDSVQAIVSLKITSKQAEFEQFILEEHIDVIASMPTTQQWLLKIDRSQFSKLSQNPDVENIKADKFHPR